MTSAHAAKQKMEVCEGPTAQCTVGLPNISPSFSSISCVYIILPKQPSVAVPMGHQASCRICRLKTNQSVLTCKEALKGYGSTYCGVA